MTDKNGNQTAEHYDPMVKTPDFTELMDELHSRPYPRIKSPVAVSRLALLNKGVDREVEIENIRELIAQCGETVEPRNNSFFYHDFPDFMFRWERHTEYSSYTVIAPIRWEKPFSGSASDCLPKDWLPGLHGQRIAAIDIEIISDHDTYRQDSPELRSLFDNYPVFGAQVIDQCAFLWTAVRVHQNGFGRALICNRDLQGPEVGRVLRSVLELDTYRNLALLALPLARNMLPEVKREEEQLAIIIERIPSIENLEQEQETLNQLSRIAALVERSISNTTYRFAATRAYSDMVSKRLLALQETPIHGVASVSAFMNWRFQPAIQTCESVNNRFLILSRRVMRATDLLRTRVDLSIQVQNQSLLKSMDERSRLSLYIQRSVEGLSVVVITYYIISLLEKLFKTSSYLPVEIDIDLVIAGLVPVILVSSWFGVRSLKKRIDSMSEKAGE